MAHSSGLLFLVKVVHQETWLIVLIVAWVKACLLALQAAHSKDVCCKDRLSLARVLHEENVPLSDLMFCKRRTLGRSG